MTTSPRLDTYCTSSKISLRPWKESDIEAWYRLSQDDGLNEFTVSSYRMKDREEAGAFVKRWMEFFLKNQVGLVPIVHQESKEVIGITAIKRLKIDDEPQEEWEIMYRLSRPYWGQGIGTLAAQMILDYGIRVLKLPRIIAVVNENNHRSRKVLVRLGFQFIRKTTYSKHPALLLDLTPDRWTRTLDQIL